MIVLLNHNERKALKPAVCTPYEKLLISMQFGSNTPKSSSLRVGD
jgi:hypothetical protein